MKEANKTVCRPAKTSGTPRRVRRPALKSLRAGAQAPIWRQNLAVSRVQLRAFCRRWKIRELALFGSVLRRDFTPDSDVDVLVTFASTARPTLLDLAHMQSELETLFGRKVDLVSRRGVQASRNSMRRQSILATAETVHSQVSC